MCIYTQKRIIVVVLKLLNMKLSLTISLLVIFFLPLSHEAAIGNRTEHTAEPPCISGCLAVHGVTNVTLLLNHRDMYYNNLLDFSIQNLRYAESSVPKPMAIILPNSKDQVKDSVLCCRQCSLEIRIRSGGHSYEGISSVVIDGSPFVIIDLMNIDGVYVDVESRTAWVEGGSTLGQTYYAISEASKVLGFPAGSCRTVGVGGHISGGGFGLLSRKYGLAADNVVDAVLVDADGRVLDRSTMGEDVFWAIRGGGGGVWGIVYAWKIKLVEVPSVVTCIGVTILGTDYRVARLVDKWQKITSKLENGFYLSCVLGRTSSSKSGESSSISISATFTGFYLGPKQEAMSILSKKFPNLKLEEDDCKEMNWIESVVYFAGSSNISHLKDRFASSKTFFKAKSDYVKDVISINGIISAFKMIKKGSKGYVILDPYGGIMDNISNDSIAFPHRKGNLFGIQYMVDWNEEENGKSKEYIKWIEEFYNIMTPYVSKSPRAAYINYMDLDLGQINDLIWPRNAVEKARVWGEKYFLSNYNRLVQVKTKIDPRNVFRHQQGIPPMPL